MSVSFFADLGKHAIENAAPLKSAVTAASDTLQSVFTNQIPHAGGLKKLLSSGAQTVADTYERTHAGKNIFQDAAALFNQFKQVVGENVPQLAKTLQDPTNYEGLKAIGADFKSISDHLTPNIGENSDHLNAFVNYLKNEPFKPAQGFADTWQSAKQLITQGGDKAADAAQSVLKYMKDNDLIKNFKDFPTDGAAQLNTVKTWLSDPSKTPSAIQDGINALAKIKDPVDQLNKMEVVTQLDKILNEVRSPSLLASTLGNIPASATSTAIDAGHAFANAAAKAGASEASVKYLKDHAEAVGAILVGTGVGGAHAVAYTNRHPILHGLNSLRKAIFNPEAAAVAAKEAGDKTLAVV